MRFRDKLCSGLASCSALLVAGVLATSGAYGQGQPNVPAASRQLRPALLQAEQALARIPEPMPRQTPTRDQLLAKIKSASPRGRADAQSRPGRLPAPTRQVPQAVMQAEQVLLQAPAPNPMRVRPNVQQLKTRIEQLKRQNPGHGRQGILDRLRNWEFTLGDLFGVGTAHAQVTTSTLSNTSTTSTPTTIAEFTAQSGWRHQPSNSRVDFYGATVLSSYAPPLTYLYNSAYLGLQNAQAVIRVNAPAQGTYIFNAYCYPSGQMTLTTGGSTYGTWDPAGWADYPTAVRLNAGMNYLTLSMSDPVSGYVRLHEITILSE